MSASETPHPAEHRGYRELYVAAQQLVDHWPALRSALPDDSPAVEAVGAGITLGQALLSDLANVLPSYDLHGDVAARGLGTNVALLRRGVRDRFLERNQALRLAVLDVQHMTTLVEYLGRVAQTRGDERLMAFATTWSERLRRAEGSVRDGAVALGSDPDGAVAPLDGSPAGRLAARAAQGVGAFGEWIDRQAAQRRTA